MLEKIAIASLIITMIHVSFWDGMINGNIRAKWLSRLPLIIRKPLYECLICMCSWWGTIIYLSFFGWHFYSNHGWIDHYLWFILAIGGLNTLIYGIIGNAEDSNGEAFVIENEAWKMGNEENSRKPIFQSNAHYEAYKNNNYIMPENWKDEKSS